MIGGKSTYPAKKTKQVVFLFEFTGTGGVIQQEAWPLSVSK